ncbi:F-box domain protein [Pandoravirus inopinatum]|uniref:F-box domain protein n=1 Tax=Pandoravirus inopinatum TaxID=1605721 RepID=A0A0B5J1K3_9VIRU|nr:F-box domain protein [Pandoravirus inopinatum]AJF97389.1 F-box domain protein [Pandoravirus inopinatum]
MEPTTEADLPDEMLCAIMRHIPTKWVWLVALVSSRWCRCAVTVTQEAAQGRPRVHRATIDELATSWPGKEYMDEAARKGHTSLVLWLRTCLGIHWRTHTVRCAALAGRQHTIDHMLASQWFLPVDEPCLVAALIGGQGLALARSIHRAGQPWTPMARAAAVALGDPSIVAQLNDQRRRRNGDDLAVTLAVACGRPDLLHAMRATTAEIAHAHRVIARQKEWSDTPFDHQALLDYATIRGLCGRDLAMMILIRFDIGWTLMPRLDDCGASLCKPVVDHHQTAATAHSHTRRERDLQPPRGAPEPLLPPPDQVAQRATARRIRQKARDDEWRSHRRAMLRGTCHHNQSPTPKRHY